MIHLDDEGFFRLFPFVSRSHTLSVVENPGQAFEGASQFGRFTRILNGINVADLKITIASFHDLSLRYQQFLDSLVHGDQRRINQSEDLIKEVLKHQGIVAVYDQITADPEFKLRVTHHDAKISNVLFDSRNRGLCVIDLDTIMPGYFISDVGDMMRTYLSPVSEEEKDFSKIEVRDDFYKAIVHGYINEMKGELTDTEIKYFFYAAKFMVYMQAIRFLTDHICNDNYYGAKYKGHNLVRANNQMVLLQRLLEKEDVLENLEAIYMTQIGR
jgi:thiamine kinase-like enzyme